MSLTVGSVVATIAVVMLAAALQRMSGFGFGLFATPLLALFMPVTQAVVVLSVAALPSSFANFREYGHDVDRDQVRRITLWSLPSMPIGLLAHAHIPNRVFGGIVSAIVVLAALVVSQRAQIPTKHVVHAERAAGFLSGLLNTSTGTNGPPLVVLFNSQSLPSDRVRGSLAYVFVSSGAVALLLFFADGLFSRTTLTLGALGIPSVLLGRYLAAPFARRLSEANFRRLAVAMLMAMGVLGIVKAFVTN
jgi:uncharacterized protein